MLLNFFIKIALHANLLFSHENYVSFRYKIIKNIYSSIPNNRRVWNNRRGRTKSSDLIIVGYGIINRRGWHIRCKNLILVGGLT